MSSTTMASPKGPHAPTGKRWRRVFMVLAIFLGGGACGAAAATVILAHSIQHVMQHPEHATAHFTAHLTSALDLTDAQTKQVHEIVGRRQHGLADIRREIEPRVKAELSGLEQEISAVLNEKQQSKWRGMADHFRSHWKELEGEAPK